MGDTVNLKSLKHNVDVFKEAIAYEFDALKEEYISLTFDDKAGTGGSRASGGLSSAADAILGVTGTAQEIALEKALQNADLDFDHKAGLLRQEILDGIELAKARAEEVKKSLTETIDQRFRDFDSTGLNEIKQKADEALKNAGAGSLLAQEAKQISEQARQQMDSKFAEYKQSVDGRFTSLSSRLDGKANLIDFQRVQETSQLYELILGTTENGIADKVARMAMTSQLFQVEVAKNVGDSRNYVRNADFRDGSKNWRETNVSGLNFNYEHSSQNRTKSGVHIYGTSINARYFGLQQTFKIELKKSDKITLSFLVSKDGYNTFSGVDVGLHYRKDGAIKSQAWKSIPNSDITASAYKKLNFNYELPVDVDEINLMFYGQQGKSINLYISEIKLETGSNATLFTLAPEDTDEAVRTVQNQLAGSWAIQNLTNAGSIVSQINATSNQILIEAEKIRLKGKTLLDELTAIDGYFKRLFVGEGNFAKLNAEIIGTNTITADKLVMDIAMARRFVSSDIFTDTLAAKEAFINKLRSVVVSATLLEGYKGKIGGFQIGTHDKDPKAYWLTGQNQFEVGMSNGNGNGFQTALWVNWGNDWDKPGIGAWFVKNSGEMYCYRPAHFWNTPVIHGNLEVTGDILYYNKDGSGVSVAGKWMYSSEYTKIERSNGYLYLYRGSNGYNWIPLNKEISDRRYKSNIKASTVSGLDVIENLKTYSYRKEYDGKIEDISCGIMAQDVQKYVPEAFFENPDGAYSYRTFELVPYLIKAIQELNQKIEKLEKTA
jgi:pblB